MFLNVPRTKITLATLGCIPAYDGYVIEGLRAEGIPYSTLNERTLKTLFDWYRKHEGDFHALRSLRERGVRYPPMKLVDMYLWVGVLPKALARIIRER
jgi:hypothetical protein